jgi:hypothetical protein
MGGGVECVCGQEAFWLALEEQLHKVDRYGYLLKFSGRLFVSRSRRRSGRSASSVSVAHCIQRFLSRSYRFQRYHRIMAPNSSCCMCMCACVLYVLCVVVDFVPYICNRVYSECSFFLEELARLKERFRLVSAQIEQVKALQVRPARAGYSLPPSPLPSIPHPSQLIKHCGVCS